MSEQPRPEQHRDYYPHDSSKVLEWHERRHEAVHEILTKAGIKGSLTLLVEERVQRLACLHFEAVAKVQRLTSELNAVLARAEKAEAALESAQKMADHWEKKAAEWKPRAEKAEFSLSNREIWIMNANTALDAAAVETHHPLAFGMRKPMALADRVQWLAKSRDDLQARAEKAEAERDEWKARAEKAEAELSRFMNMPSCSPELFLRSAQRTEKPAPIDWGRVRIDAAIATMQGMWACPDANFERPMEVISVECADALVAELQKKEVQG